MVNFNICTVLTAAKYACTNYVSFETDTATENNVEKKYGVNKPAWLKQTHFGILLSKLKWSMLHTVE